MSAHGAASYRAGLRCGAHSEAVESESIMKMGNDGWTPSGDGWAVAVSGDGWCVWTKDC